MKQVSDQLLTTFVIVDWDFSLADLSTDSRNKKTSKVFHLHIKPKFPGSSNEERLEISMRQPASSIKPGDWVYFGKQPFAVTSRCDDVGCVRLRLGHNLTVNYHEDSTVGLWVN